MKTADALALASRHLLGLRGREFDLLDVAKPVSPAAAINLAKIISKLSPLVGNLIEFNTCEYLNELPDFAKWGHWRRQDPGFPDTIFDGKVTPCPGFEIKAWFPLATEITARFKDSQNHFSDENTNVALLAWLPEFLIFGKPHVIDIVVVSGSSVAKARDDHYHNPPDYVVNEPRDTTKRTKNLQQTNTAGYKFQGTKAEFAQAEKLVASWGRDGRRYQPSAAYQERLIELQGKFPYRLDTNFAKIDRIVHPEIEAFKGRTYGTELHGRTIAEWKRLLSGGDEEEVGRALADAFGIRENDGDSVIER